MTVNSLFNVKGHVSSLIAQAKLTRDESSLKGKIIRNASWIIAGYGAEVFIRLGSSVIVTRLLDPSAYGIMSTVMVFVTVLALLSDLGLQPIVLTDARGDEPDFLHSIWTVQILRGFVLAILTGCLALGWHMFQVMGWIASTSDYSNPILPSALGVLAVALAIEGFSSINSFRLLRNLEQRPLTILEIMTRVLTSVMTIAAAYYLRSVWALIIATIIGFVFRTILSNIYLPGPRMRMRFHMVDMTKIMKNSRWIALSSTMSVIVTSGDKLFVGYGFGMAALGVLTVGTTLFDALRAIMDRVQSTMGVSVMRAVADRDHAAQMSAYFRFRFPTDLYCAVVGTGLAIFGPLFFSTLYDSRYHEAGIYVAILGAGMVVYPLSLGRNLLISNQRFKFSAAVTVVKTVTFLTTMTLAVSYGSMKWAVLVIALQRVPDWILYFLVPSSGVPFRWRRDGPLIILAAVLLAFVYHIDT